MALRSTKLSVSQGDVLLTAATDLSRFVYDWDAGGENHGAEIQCTAEQSASDSVAAIAQ